MVERVAELDRVEDINIEFVAGPPNSAVFVGNTCIVSGLSSFGIEFATSNFNLLATSFSIVAVSYGIIVASMYARNRKE